MKSDKIKLVVAIVIFAIAAIIIVMYSGLLDSGNPTPTPVVTDPKGAPRTGGAQRAPATK